MYGFPKSHHNHLSGNMRLRVGAQNDVSINMKSILPSMNFIESRLESGGNDISITSGIGSARDNFDAI